MDIPPIMRFACVFDSKQSHRHVDRSIFIGEVGQPDKRTRALQKVRRKNNAVSEIRAFVGERVKSSDCSAKKNMEFVSRETAMTIFCRETRKTRNH
ncbi:hypothetical protein AVEN_272598-1 [Araneus ventricosus]|uniref:Uncharacterized protein n=1 Tax=Araneus ventricosus TaxID=182803 RepID=A0A4Y2GIX1_ARAVE|nr:hypothetical protein AVEN_272598-1 [Araneus ventricosus]